MILAVPNSSTENEIGRVEQFAISARPDKMLLLPRVGPQKPNFTEPNPQVRPSGEACIQVVVVLFP